MREINESWVTTALSDSDGLHALTLSKSLKRTLTTRRLTVLISDNVAAQMKFLLTQEYDHVVRLEKVDSESESGIDIGLLAKIYCWSLKAWNKCVYLDPRALVLQSCDELFTTFHDNFAAIKCLASGDYNTSIFVYRPSLKIFEELYSQAENNNAGRDDDLINKYFKGCKTLSDKMYCANGNPDRKAKIIISKNPKEQSHWLNVFHADVQPMLKKQNLESLQKYVENLLLNLELSNAKAETSSITHEPSMDHLEELKNSIAVIGMSCRFPNAANASEYWKLLSEGQDAIRPFPNDRPLTASDLDASTKMHAGFLNVPVDEFDAKFFGISPREAPFIDPQQRLLLEVTWESLENAGLNPQALRDTNTGVFLGIWQQDYERLLPDTSLETNDFFHRYLGNEFSATASRISFCLGLHGPAIASESGCSSALGGLHLACESLRRGESSLAIAAGVNLVLIPFNPFSGKGESAVVLSKDFKCKTFDAEADGFVRAEGCGVIVLKRFNEAYRDGDNILAVIRGSALNNDGAGTSFGTPNAKAQERVFREALADANVAAAKVSYLEAHGTGTVVGDPIEMYAVGQVYSEERTEPLYVSSVKTNIGHCEAAAGIASVCKVILCFKHKQIPPHLNLKNLNPRINLEKIPAKIPQELTNWETTPRIAAVSSFSMSGTNVHMVLQEAPPRPPSEIASVPEPQVVTLSAKSEEALHALVELYMDYLKQNPNISLRDIAYMTNTGRAHLTYRIGVASKTTSQLLNRLQKKGLIHGKIPASPQSVGFLFTGQGSQYIGMGKNLYENFTVFRQAMDNCDKLFYKHLNASLLKVIWDDSHDLLDKTIYCQPAIFCIEYSLVELWKSLGVTPDYVLGHSVGEFGAAVAAGVITLEEGMELVAGRSKLVETLPNGNMLALRGEQDRMLMLVKKFNKEGLGIVDVAAINSPEEIVISGGTESIEKFNDFCVNNSIKTISVPASHAFHSRDMDTILEEFGKIAAELSPNKPKITYVSGTLARVLDDAAEFGADYWKRHLRDTVRFSSAIQQVFAECKVLVEVGPQPILLGLTMGSIKDTANCQFCPSLRRNEEDWNCLLGSLSKLYVGGVDIKWWSHSVTKPRKSIILPNYPFQRQKFWFKANEFGETNDGVTGLTTPLLHPLLGRQFPSPLSALTFCQTYSQKDLDYVLDHRVAEKIVVPAAAFLESFMAAGRQVLGSSGRVPIVIENVVVEAALEMDKPINIQTIVSGDKTDASKGIEYKVSINRQVVDQWKRHANAVFSPSSRIPGGAILDIEALKEKLTCKDMMDKIYSQIAEVGIQFGPKFQSIKQAWVGEKTTELLTKIQIPENSTDYICHPIVLDAIIQTCAFRDYLMKDNKDQGLLLPIGIKRFAWLSKEMTPIVYAYSSAEDGNINLYSENGEILAMMEGLELFQTTVDSVVRALRSIDSIGIDNMQEIWRVKSNVCSSRVEMLHLQGPSLETPYVSEVISEAEKHVGEGEAFGYINQLHIFYLIRGIQECDWPFGHTGDEIEAANWRKHLPASLNSRIIDFWLHELMEYGYLEVFGEDAFGMTKYKVKKPLETILECEKEINYIITTLNARSDADAAILFAKRFGDHFTQLLKGKITGLNVLFPEDENEMGAIRFYSESYWYLQNSELAVAHCLDTISNITAKDGVVRILEVGAGSGVSSLQIINKLNELGVPHQFTYTDISPLFVSEAKKKLGTEVTYGLLNIEEDPLAQGFSPDYYDVVLAMQVIHATADIHQSLQNIKKLLRIGGRVMIAEQFLAVPFITCPFSTLDGWWRFKDFRKLGPIINGPTWEKCLTDSGFSDSHAVEMYTGFLGAITGLKREEQIYPEISPARVWLFFGDGGDLSNQVYTRLGSYGRRVVRVRYELTPSRDSDDTVIINPNHLPDFVRLLGQYLETTEGVIYTWTGLDSSNVIDAHNTLIPPILNICKAYHEQATKLVRKPKLIFVSRGVNYIGDTVSGNPHASTVWGLLKTFSNECPELHVCLIDTDQNGSEHEAEQVFSELWSKEREHFISFRGDKKYVQRLVYMDKEPGPVMLPNTDRYKFINPPSGSFADIDVGPYQKFDVDGANVELEVRATALNFRDLFMVLKPEGFNLRPEQLDSIGLDISGIVVKAGPQCHRLQVGDEVFGFTSTGGLASHVIAPEKVLMKKPKWMTFNEASTIPCAFLTAYVSLVQTAKLTSEDRVLIHVASGGVGLAAIQVAKHIGAEIFATAGNKRKRAYLRALGIQYIYHSRNTSYGEGIKRDTNGRGVTVVLNSLTGPNFKEETLGACSKGARFIEIAKLNIWTNEEVAALRPDVKYDILDLSSMDTSDETEALFAEMEKYVHDGIYTGLPSVNFPLEQVRQAFYHFQEAKHIGKIVVSMPFCETVNGKLLLKHHVFNEESTYLITGGLGGLGIEVTKWMITTGARNIVLVNRNPPKPKVKELINFWNSTGANIIVLQSDIGVYENCVQLLQSIKNLGLPPLRGIMHAAGVLADNFIPNQTFESLETVFRPKIYGGWFLHQLTANYQLEFFVMFSSMTAIFAMLGQCNHVAANKFLDSLAHLRVSMGLPATSINWGAWSDVGAAAHIKLGQEGGAGIRSFTPSQGITALEKIMKRHNTQIGVIDVTDWNLLKQIVLGLGNYLEEMKSDKEETRNNEYEHLVEEIQNAAPGEKQEKIQKYMESILKQTLKLPENEVIDIDQNFSELGVDSLMAMEMKNRLQGLLGHKTLSVSSLQENRTIRSLSSHLAYLLNSESIESIPISELVKQDSTLPAEINISGSCQPVKPSEFQNILLTGATGHLGIHFLAELLKSENEKSYSIYCLIRAKSHEEARQRLESTLHKYDMIVDLDERVRVLAGDVSKDRLGLTEDEYKKLSSSIDAVIHCAIKANHLDSYTDGTGNDMRTSNVFGLVNVLKFTAAEKTKVLLHASSLLAATKVDPDGKLSEDFPDESESGANILQGYSLSKFVCEKLIRQAIERGIPCLVIRYPTIFGHSVTGNMPTGYNHAWNILLACIRVRCFPKLFNDKGLPVMPVDICARISTELFLKDDAETGIYNLTNDSKLDENDIKEVFSEYGVDGEFVSFKEWRDAVFEDVGGEEVPEHDKDLSILGELYTDKGDDPLFRTLHPLATEVENVDFVTISNKLLFHLPSITQMLVPAKDIIRRHLDYHYNNAIKNG